ncbi:MAG: hypothetical protein AAFV59_03930 [Pseudomonadota bacterium]
MDNSNIETCLNAVEATFEIEADCIVRSDLGALSDVAKSKVEQLSVLANAIEAGALRGQTKDTIRRVMRLQATAIEHDRHLQAMRHGLSRTLQRLERLQSDASVGSYNKQGDRVQFSGARGGYESKA